MAKKITELTELTTTAEDDLIIIEDVSTSTTKKITKTNFFKTIITDALTISGVASAEGWSALGATPDTITYNGNRSYDLVFNGNDLTDTVSVGMRLKATRTVAAPTRCADLEASSSQYFNKTTPAGMTFTDDAASGGWIKVESYTAGDVMSRWNGTSGWRLTMTAQGSLWFLCYKGSAANFSYVSSYQSLPLNKWVHVAAQIDMSAFTNTATTSYVMFDGQDVPAAVNRGGTNPTDLTQAGNLEVGAGNGGAAPFDGKIAQIFVSSAKITQANIRTLISQGLTAALISTHSIVSAYSFDNSIADLNTSNANNLTAQNSALATNADSPFSQDDTNTPLGNTDFGIITKKVFSTNTTLTVQVPEGCTIPTSGGVSVLSYSTHGAPYGFPATKGRWILETIYCQAYAQATAATTSYNNALAKLVVPIGAFTLAYMGNLYLTDTAALTGQAPTNLSYTAASLTPVSGKLTTNSYLLATGATGVAAMFRLSAEDSVNHAAATAVYVNIYSETAVDGAYWYVPLAQVGARSLTISALTEHL